MTIKTRVHMSVVTGTVALAALCGSFAIGQAGAEDQPRKTGKVQGEPQLPPGWSESDMQACVQAGAPGKMHEFLTTQIGVWQGRSQMWMGPAATEPVTGTCTWTVSPIMDGRYIECRMTGELPGMGPFTGLGITGFDNVSQKFVGSWIDNHSTGIMQGVGELSADEKTLSWAYSYNCPLTKRPAVVRQVDNYAGANEMSFDMFTTDPKSGREYKCMHVDLTRKS
jgi:hypothetical protein